MLWCRSVWQSHVTAWVQAFSVRWTQCLRLRPLKHCRRSATVWWAGTTRIPPSSLTPLYGTFTHRTNSRWNDSVVRHGSHTDYNSQSDSVCEVTIMNIGIVRLSCNCFVDVFKSYFSRGGAPFIGMIVSPYDPANPSPHSQTTCLLVKESQDESGSESMSITHKQ